MLLIAASGFLLGQLFFGTFSYPASMAGFFGLAGGILGGKFSSETRLRAQTVIACCFIALLGVGLDAIEYYRFLDCAGNYYAWPLIGPYGICLGLIIVDVWGRMPSGRLE